MPWVTSSSLLIANTPHIIRSGPSAVMFMDVVVCGSHPDATTNANKTAKPRASFLTIGYSSRFETLWPQHQCVASEDVRPRWDNGLDWSRLQTVFHRRRGDARPQALHGHLGHHAYAGFAPGATTDRQRRLAAQPHSGGL